MFPCVRQPKSSADSFINIVYFKKVWSFTTDSQFIFIEWKTALLQLQLVFSNYIWHGITQPVLEETNLFFVFKVFGKFKYFS